MPPRRHGRSSDRINDPDTTPVPADSRVAEKTKNFPLTLAGTRFRLRLINWKSKFEQA